MYEHFHHRSPDGLRAIWFDAKEYPRLSLVLSILVITLILAPLVEIRLYYWVMSDIGADNPFAEPWLDLGLGFGVALVLSLPCACSVVLVSRLIARHWKANGMPLNPRPSLDSAVPSFCHPGRTSRGASEADHWAQKRVVRKFPLIICCALGLAAVAFWFFQPVQTFDIQRVDSRLLSLQQPYRTVKTAYYADGGSIGIEIIDRDGRLQQFAIPSHFGDSNRYTRVFVGSMCDRTPGAIEIINPEHTKRMLISVLQANARRSAWDDLALMALRRHPVDFARCLVHRWRGDYKS